MTSLFLALVHQGTSKDQAFNTSPMRKSEAQVENAGSASIKPWVQPQHKMKTKYLPLPLASVFIPSSSWKWMFTALIRILSPFLKYTWRTREQESLHITQGKLPRFHRQVAQRYGQQGLLYMGGQNGSTQISSLEICNWWCHLSDRISAQDSGSHRSIL